MGGWSRGGGSVHRAQRERGATGGPTDRAGHRAAGADRRGRAAGAWARAAAGLGLGSARGRCPPTRPKGRPEVEGWRGWRGRGWREWWPAWSCSVGVATRRCGSGSDGSVEPPPTARALNRPPRGWRGGSGRGAWPERAAVVPLGTRRSAISLVAVTETMYLLWRHKCTSPLPYDGGEGGEEAGAGAQEGRRLCASAEKNGMSTARAAQRPSSPLPFPTPTRLNRSAGEHMQAG